MDGMTDKQRILERCLDDGARQVEALNAFATAADQRAVTVASVYIGSATAIGAALIGWVSQAGQSISWPIIAAGTVSAALFYVAAVLCLWTAFPRRTPIAGNPPEFWNWSISKGKSYEEAMTFQIEEYERKIAENSADRRGAAIAYRIGAVMGASAPIAGAIVFGVSFLL